jgi:hypothetical protein
MQDYSSKRARSVEAEEGGDIEKRVHLTIFEEDRRKKAISIKETTLANVRDAAQTAKDLNAEHTASLEKIKKQYEEECFGVDEEDDGLPFKMDDEEKPSDVGKFYADETEWKLCDYVRETQYFSDYSRILQSAKSLCRFIDSDILVPVQKAIPEIRTLCGYVFGDESTYKEAAPHTALLCQIASELDDAKSEFYKKHIYLYDRMDEFMRVYISAEAADKENFSVRLHKKPGLGEWIKPWIRMAEKMADPKADKKDISHDLALMESQQTFENLPVQQKVMPVF